MKLALIAAFTLAIAFILTVPALGTSARPAQTGPEYGIVVSAIAGGLQGTKRVYNCPGPDLTGVTEALGGPQAVEKLGLELVAEALGSRKKPWPRNHRAFTYHGTRWVPDFIKGNTFYVVDTGKRLDLTPEIRDLQAIARKRRGQLVVVTRRKAAITATLSKATSRWWTQSAGRVRILRCI
jgi:hypothetical protein